VNSGKRIGMTSIHLYSLTIEILRQLRDQEWKLLGHIHATELFRDDIDSAVRKSEDDIDITS
jgi:hypothetical protein